MKAKIVETFKDKIAAGKLKLAMNIIRLTNARSFRAALRRPGKTQRRVLKEIIRRNKNTIFGRAYRFGKIRNPLEYRRTVPVSDYESSRVYIERDMTERSKKRKTRALTREEPFYYSQTSGTLGLPKNIPITDSFYRGFRKSLRLYSVALYDYDPEIYSGGILAVVGPAEESKTDTGVSIGSLTGLIYAEMPAAIRARYILPPETFSLADRKLRYRVILQAALARADLSGMAAANPSTFLLLADLLRAEGKDIIRDMEAGKPPKNFPRDKRLRTIFAPLLTANRERIAFLKKALGKPKGPSFLELWPNLIAINSWTGGNCAYAARLLQKTAGRFTPILDPGYVASEFRGTINIDPRNNLSVPHITENYYEFRRTTESGEPYGEFLGLEELEEDREYRIYATTRAGLYRYDINDIVRTNGRVENTPALVFVRKGAGATNITGEKLTETQVLGMLEHLPVAYPFAAVRADALNFRYIIFLESNEKESKREISRRADNIFANWNREYREKRRSGRLHAPRVVFLKRGTGEAYRAHRIAEGQRDAQYKDVLLRDWTRETFPFGEYAASGTRDLRGRAEPERRSAVGERATLMRRERRAGKEKIGDGNH